MLHAARIAGLAALLALAAGAQAATPDTTLTDKDGRVRTQLSARNDVVISSELSAKIASLPLREGDAFRAGQTLVSFDCTLFQAQLAKARATNEAAQQTLAVNKRLAELNSVGRLEVDQAEAKVKESGAEVAYMQATVSKCQIPAPFAGRVVKRVATAQQYVTPGTQLIAIIDSGELEVQMIVPSRWLASVKNGTRFSVQVDELGKSFPARVVRTGARIDPVSQSIQITGVMEAPAGTLLPGMSGWAVFAGTK
ncbi:efflux RND transporter periplasmic adaptor subunit [Uliginosibacterium sp. sgz301328]|uniref:efflux RND transporter periplasmic adaptor subunit n=1 Tax=Uliginosibacterium sp. sgz301328 TaxID=3243764 RepID=UPI00359E510B